MADPQAPPPRDHGTLAGQRADEIELDLDALPEGLLGVIGPNGAGKSTLLEHLTPWPKLLTRKGPIQQHMRLRDSFRELTVIDELSGDEYVCLLQVDAQNGKRESRVYE